MKHGVALILLAAACSTGSEATTNTASEISSTGGSATSATTPGLLKPGAAAGAFPLGELDVINLFNGRIHVRLPLREVGGRGEAGYTMTLPIALDPWSVAIGVDNDPTGGGLYYAYPTRKWWAQVADAFGAGTLGIRKEPGLVDGRLHTLTRLTFTDAGGSEVELLDDRTGGAPREGDEFNRGRVFRSHSGEFLRFESDRDLSDERRSDDVDQLRGTLYFPNGTHYRIEKAVVTRIVDRHGNVTTLDRLYEGRRVTRLTVTDPIGRRTTVELGSTNERGTSPFEHRIRYPGFGGSTRTIIVRFAPLYDSGARNIPTTWGMFPSAHIMTCLNNTCPAPNLPINPIVLKEAELPDGRTYAFTYNAYVELSGITLPTGARYEYEWGPSANADRDGVVRSDNPRSFAAAIYRRVRTKRVYANGSRVTATTTFEDAIGSALGRPATEVIVKTYDGDRDAPLLSKERHVYFGVPSNGAMAAMVRHFYYNPWREGLEHKAETLAVDGSDTVLAAKRYSWEQADGGDDDDAPPRDPRRTRTKNTLDDGSSWRVDTTYDARGNPIAVETFDFEAKGGTFPIKRVRTRYLDGAYLDPPVYMLSLPSETSVFAVDPSSGAETLFSRTRTTYDGAPAERCRGIGGHEGGGELRGNATAVEVMNVDTGEWIGTRTQYDEAGNAVRSIDALGRVTEIGFDDAARTYARPVRTTNALGHVARTSYDPSTWLPVELRDANGAITTYAYDDALERPTFARAAGLVERRIAYDDARPGNTDTTIATKADFASAGDGALETESVLDGLGRETRRRSRLPDGAWLETRTQYDGLGRTARVSEAYIKTRDATPIWTETRYDGLGRISSVTAPDGSRSEMRYSGASVTITDASGRKQQKIADVFGRTAAVIEAPDTYGYRTEYRYDLGDRLRSVEQGEQSRWFLHDGLGRLIRERQPERDANPLLAVRDPLTGHDEWDTAYAYDEVNRLVRRVDARGVITEHTYDALDRTVSTTYSDGTPNVTREYDGARLGIGRPWRANVARGDFGVSTEIVAYDELGRELEQSQQFLDGAAFTHRRAYHASGATKSELYPSGHLLEYFYDSTGRLESTRGDLGDGFRRPYTSEPGYDDRARLVRVRLGAIYQHFRFNDRSQLVRVGLGTALDAVDRGALEYCYASSCSGGTDNLGIVRRMEQTIPGGAPIRFTFEHDALHRTARALVERGDAFLLEQRFDYDRYGNRVVLSPGVDGTASYRVFARTNRIDDPSLEYDAAGNVTRQGDQTFFYDAENRMILAYDAAGHAASYAYDTEGRRVYTRGRERVARYVYGIGGGLVAEYAESTPPDAPELEHGPGIVADAAGPRWLISDQLGSPRIIVDASGEAHHRLLLPYGQDVALEGLADDRVVRRRFTTYERDDDTGLDYALARWYSAPHGRYLGVDPLLASAKLDDPQSWNRYSYVGSRPTMFIDPTGAFWEELGGAFGNAGKGFSNAFVDALLEGPKDLLLAPTNLALNVIRAVAIYHELTTGEAALDIAQLDKAAGQLNREVFPHFEAEKDAAYYAGYAGGTVVAAVATDLVSAPRSVTSIARATEGLVQNETYGTCLTGALMNNISGRAAGYETKTLYMEIFRESGESGYHAVTQFGRGKEAQFVSWGQVSNNLDDLMRSNRFPKHIVHKSYGDLPALMREVKRSGWEFKWPGDLFD